MIEKLVQENISFSTQIMVMSGSVFVFILIVFSFLWIKHARSVSFSKRLQNISADIQSSSGKSNDNVDRIKVLKKIIDTSAKTQQISLFIRLTYYIKKIRRKTILSKLIFFNLVFSCCIFLFTSMNIILLLGTISVFFVSTLVLLVKRYENAKMRNTVSQLPMAIDLLIRSLEAGLNINHAFALCATQLDDPIKLEFSTMNRDMVAGLTTAEAVQKFYERIPHPSVSFFYALVAAQSKSGGSLARGLSSLSASLRNRRTLENKMISLTSEPRTSMKVLLAIPAIFTVVSFFIQPDKMLKLISTPEGQFYLVPMLVWCLIGVYVMYKMTELRD